MYEGIAQLIGTIEGLTYSDEAEANVFLDDMPSAPERAVGVYTQSGQEPDSKLPYDPVAFQVVVRCEAGSDWGRDTWRAIYSKLHGLRNVTLPDGTYAVFVIAEHAGPFRLGPDEAGRPRLTGDYRGEYLNPTEERQ